MFRLEKVEGPECPDCGCLDNEVLQEQVRTGVEIDPVAKTQRKMIAKSEYRLCLHCRVRFWIRGGWEPADPDQAPQPTIVDVRRDGRICPICGAGPSATRATSTQGAVQYRKCGCCGERFKNVAE
jgi:hypothetical protein